MTRNQPPITSNIEAAALIAKACRKCRGCREFWRLPTASFHHRNGMICTAKEERQALRDIAARARAKEKETDS